MSSTRVSNYQICGIQFAAILLVNPAWGRKSSPVGSAFALTRIK
jgi:hypothetical protein